MGSCSHRSADTPACWRVLRAGTMPRRRRLATAALAGTSLARCGRRRARWGEMLQFSGRWPTADSHPTREEPPKDAGAGRRTTLFHHQLALENLALRHQLAVYRRTTTRPKLGTRDRLFWVGLARIWAGWRPSFLIVTPDTVLQWQRRRFREYWTQLSRRTRRGRRPSTPRSRLSYLAWPPRTPCGARRASTASSSSSASTWPRHRLPTDAEESPEQTASLRILTGYFAYYHRARTHLSLEKDARHRGRPVEQGEVGKLVEIAEVGGLHHRYVRRAA